jgi:16S rRNA (guanine(966)-N(2))-methyltransferase RsmD
MRIISGKFKSRLIKSPSNDYYVRPTTDRARETLFNILYNKFDFSDTVCFDLFCGTGSFGIECISRGAGKVYFVDKDIKLAKENIGKLNSEDYSVIFRSDAVMFLKNSMEIKADIVFADPPYSYGHYSDLLKAVSVFKTIFILEHSENLSISEEYKKYLYLQKKIGITYFSFYDFNKEQL